MQSMMQVLGMKGGGQDADWSCCQQEGEGGGLGPQGVSRGRKGFSLSLTQATVAKKQGKQCRPQDTNSLPSPDPPQDSTSTASSMTS